MIGTTCFMQVRILVTHGIGFLPQCDVIVVMADGQITEVGSYTELIDNDGAFAQFLQTHQSVDNIKEEDPGNQSNCSNYYAMYSKSGNVSVAYTILVLHTLP